MKVDRKDQSNSMHYLNENFGFQKSDSGSPTQVGKEALCPSINKL